MSGAVELTDYKTNPDGGFNNDGFTSEIENGDAIAEADRKRENKIPEVVVTIEPSNAVNPHSGDKTQYTEVKVSDFKQKLSSNLQKASEAYERHSREVYLVLAICIVIGYFVYFGFAMDYEFGSQESITLLWVTCFAVFCFILWLTWRFCGENIKNCCRPCLDFLDHHGRTILWIVLAIFYLFFMIFVLVDVFYVTDEPYNLVSLGGLLTYVLFCFLFSHSPLQVNWRAVLWGIALQFMFSLIILRWSWGYEAFDWLGTLITNFLSKSDAGAEFVFGEDFRDHFFAFSVLPVVIYFSSIISMLYYLGWMQVAIKAVGWLLQSLMGTTAGESLNAAGNIFIGQTEAPLMIRPLLKDMTRSELHAVMTGGFATIAGSVLAGYIQFGVPANHLLSASVMSAPAALAISKLFYPETEVSKTTAEDVKKLEKGAERNIIEAAAAGASQSIQLVANIAANLIAFIALLELLNSLLAWIGDRVGWNDPQLSFELICSYVFYPLALVMGVSLDDCRMVAELIGVKTFINEFAAYERLGVLINNGEAFTSHLSMNGTYEQDGRDVILYNYTDVEGTLHNQTVLENGVLGDRSEVISTYALCGFANIGSMGIMLGGLSPMAPDRKSDMAAVVVRAMIAGNVACFMTACIAGLFYQEMA